MAEGTT